MCILKVRIFHGILFVLVSESLNDCIWCLYQNRRRDSCKKFAALTVELLKFQAF
jgi:hypothetical protein